MSNINNTKVEVGFNAEVRQALADFIAAKEQEKAAKVAKENAEKILRDALGENVVATIGGIPAFKLEFRTRPNVPVKDLQNKYPEIYAELKTETSYDFIDAIKK